MNIAILGASGLVGRKIIDVLNEKKIDARYFLFAHSNGLGQRFDIMGKTYEVQKLDEENIAKMELNYAFFAVGSENSRILVPKFANLGVKCIDNSNAFRREKDVPLVVTSVNKEALKQGKFIFANPNCSTIELVTALKPLSDVFGLKRVVVSTYQAVSGAGKWGIYDLENGTTKKFAFPIVDNIIPQIDIFLENGYTREEDKLIFESRKILGLPKLKITATAARVPVKNCHCESVNVELSRPASVEEVKEALKQSTIVLDDPQNQIYPLPRECDERNEVFVGRIRRDFSQKNAFNMWVVADNLRRGAATNAVEIMQELENERGF